MKTLLRRWGYAAVAIALAIFMLTAMAWITQVGLRQNREALQTQVDTDFNNQIRLALWRLDSALAPLIATEAAKPVEVVSSLAKNGLPQDPASYLLGYFEGSYLPPPMADSKTPRSQDAKDLEIQIESSGVSMDWISRLPMDGTFAAALVQLESWNDASDPVQTPLVLDSMAPGNQDSRSLPASNALQAMNRLGPAAVPQSDSSLVEDDATQAKSNALAYSNQASLDLVQRGNLYQGNIAAQNDSQQQLLSSYQLPNSTGVSLEKPPLFKPFWVGNQLYLLRKIKSQSEPSVRVSFQGGLLNWPAMRDDSLNAIADLLQEPTLAPKFTGLQDVDPLDSDLRSLASLPAILDAAKPKLEMRWTPMTLAIAGGWIAVSFTLVIGGVLLLGLWRLSEQRASFVSAVTHELRTPLTTFRMYSEMLANNMIPAEKQASYLQTLCQQSDRLTHLIDNVLTFARLERKAIANHQIELTVGELVHSMKQTLEQRMVQSEFRLSWEPVEDVLETKIRTDPSAVEQILSNLVDNAVKYAATAELKSISIAIYREGSSLILDVIDHGPGVSEQELRRLFRPFSRSAEQAAGSSPGVGLGLALCRRLARSLKGELTCPSSSRVRTNGVSFAGTNGCTMRLRLPLGR